MGKVTTLFARKVAGVVDDNVDRNALLESIGVNPKRPEESPDMIPDVEYYAFLERIAAAESDATTLPLRAGATMRLEEYGAFGLAWKSALTLRGSFDRAVRFWRVLTSVSAYEVENTDGGAFWHLRRAGKRRLGLRLSNEATIASIATISREACSTECNPLEVHFRHAAPASTAAHEAWFGCPVYFASDRDALLLSDETLDTPNRVGDPAISTFFQSQLESEISTLDDDYPLERRVIDYVSPSLSEGVPTVSEISRQLGVSSRTLQRRLSERNLTYQELVDQSRRQLARRLLRTSEFPLNEIAFMTGYSDQSSFTRAFKRWAGQTPRSYRLEGGARTVRS